MTKIYPYLAGKTLDFHEPFLKKLTDKGAKVVQSPEESDVTIVFCPIVSRFETDIESALSSIPGKHADTQMHMQNVMSCFVFSCKLWSVFSVSIEEGHKKLIVVAMHHTFDKKYTLPKRRKKNPEVTLFVDCLFSERFGLLNCSRNKVAVKNVCEEVIKKQVQHPF